MNNKKRVLSLFSGCGGMDIGFEGGFKCLKRSINTDVHPNWIVEENGDWVKVANTGFETVLLTISDRMQKQHGCHIFLQYTTMQMKYII